jgi:hypothetical protein
MAKGKKVAKAPKSKSQPKAPAKKQPKQKAPPAPHKATRKRPAEELSSDDVSEDETSQKPQKKRSKVVEHVDSDNVMDSDDPEHESDNDEAHGGQQPQSDAEVRTYLITFDC